MEINHRFINFILIILITYILIKNISNEKKLKSIEKFVNVQDVDIDAIRNLSEIAKELQKGGLTVAGDLTVTGKIKTKNIDVGENLQIEGGTKLTKNNNNTISGDTTFSNNLQINGTTNANSIEASNVTATNKIQTKHLDITNGSNDEEKWTKFNDNGKNYMSGHNWIEAKGSFTGGYPDCGLDDFAKYKGFKPGYMGFGKISHKDNDKSRDITSIIAHSGYGDWGHSRIVTHDIINDKILNYSNKHTTNPIIREVSELPNNTYAAKYYLKVPGYNLYRSYDKTDNDCIQDNIIYNLKRI
tara:strand:- start:47 stop:946 length:900 start_codon:yes stop_codon:yes gene_type:complete